MAFCSPSTIFLMLLLFHSLQLHKSAHGDDERYEACKKTFQCGNVSLSYPFYDENNRPAYCGYPGFRFNCSNAKPEIYMSSETYYILNVDPTSYTISVAWQRFWDDLCPEYLHNASITQSLYKYTPQDKNITLIYNCPKTSSLLGNEIFCDNSKRYRKQYSPVEYIMTQDLESSLAKNLNTTCPDSILVPVPVHGDLYSTITDSISLQDAILTGFGLEWIAENELCDICSASGGECGYNEKIPGFICYCPDQPYDSKCRPGGNGSTPHKIPKYAKVLIACLGTLIGIGMLVLLAYYVRRRRNSTNNQDIDDFLRTNGSLTPKKYTYKFLKKITNSFADNNKLGEGGYGIVYKGKLRKDHLVAVKLLKESREIAEDFSNEVESIGRTNHINIVRLLGFCCEGQKRALVYAFMPNGSLDKFISGKKNCLSLASDKLLEIALGIARGLQYLHQFCNTRIVHFDIKPHNILLDEKFCPKISDFGLAKRCQTNASIVSMSQARGTRGFIAPEVNSKSHGEVSHKSDVYSYGMLVVDMVGCRRNVNVDKRRSTQYFPDWIYDQLEQMEEDENQEMLNGQENEKFRKMILVSLWCIQKNPLKRPAMNKVVEMLEGPLDLLQIPPKPSLSSSRISKHSSSTEYTTSE